MSGLILVFVYWRFFQYAVAGKLNRSIFYAEPDVRVNGGKKELIRNRRELAFRKGYVCCKIKPIVAWWWFFWGRAVLDYHTLLKGVIFCICMFAYRQKNRWGSLWLSRPLMRADFPCRSRSPSSLMPRKCFYQPALLRTRYHRVCPQLRKKLNKSVRAGEKITSNKDWCTRGILFNLLKMWFTFVIKSHCIPSLDFSQIVASIKEKSSSCISVSKEPSCIVGPKQALSHWRITQPGNPSASNLDLCQQAHSDQCHAIRQTWS